MTNVFPSLPGLAWSVFKSPQFKTRIQKSVSNRELRLTFQPMPTWEFKLKFSFLRDKNDTRQPNWGTSLNELRTLMGFFLQQQGSLTPFLLDDPTDDSATDQALENTTTGGTTGDGTTTTFQLIRTMNGFNEPIIAPNELYDVYLNGVLQSPSSYSLNSGNGILTFNTAPGAGVNVTATFTYYFLVRFGEDTSAFENFLYQLWSANEIKLQSILL